MSGYVCDSCRSHRHDETVTVDVTTMADPEPVEVEVVVPDVDDGAGVIETDDRDIDAVSSAKRRGTASRL